MLTAVAAVVTAVGGLYFGFSGGGGDRDPVAAADVRPDRDEVSESTATGTTLPPPDEPPPSDSVDPTEIDTGNLGGVDTADLGSDVDRTIQDCSSGSADACLVLLDQLTDECATGAGVSCDALYFVSPVGSDYEFFGATCGGRFDASFAGSCSAL